MDKSILIRKLTDEQATLLNDIKNLLNHKTASKAVLCMIENYSNLIIQCKKQKEKIEDLQNTIHAKNYKVNSFLSGLKGLEEF